MHGTQLNVSGTNAGFEARRILTQAHQNNGGGGAKSINEMIPLNRYSFFQELEKKMLSPMQTQLNVSNFSSLYGLIYFDLTYQKEVVTRDPKQLILHYRLNVAPTANVRAHSIVFYESEVVVKTVGNELMIV